MRRRSTPAAFLFALLTASACTTGGDPFRAVGVDSPPQAEVELPVAVDSETTATAIPAETQNSENDADPIALPPQPATATANSNSEAVKLQEGVSMNLGSAPEVQEGPASPEDIPPAPELATT
ncbi:MAG: hypothetical protein ACR2O0_14545, partial [Rhizobiaceae bacterium]